MISVGLTEYINHNLHNQPNLHIQDLHNSLTTIRRQNFSASSGLNFINLQLILCQFIQILKDFLNKMSDFIPNFSLNLNMNRAEDELL